jgi:hypothetical protein
MPSDARAIVDSHFGECHCGCSYLRESRGISEVQLSDDGFVDVTADVPE